MIITTLINRLITDQKKAKPAGAQKGIVQISHGIQYKKIRNNGGIIIKHQRKKEFLILYVNKKIGSKTTEKIKREKHIFQSL